MKSNNGDGTRDGSKTIDEWRTSINNERSAEAVRVSV